MNDLAQPSTDQSDTSEVEVRALRRPVPAPDVDVRALAGAAPVAEVDTAALSRPPAPDEAPKSRLRRRLAIGVVAVVLVAVGGTGLWWNRQVVADPRLAFSGGLNVYRDAPLTDRSGIVRRDRHWHDDAEEVDVAFVPGGRLYGMVGLYNGGAHDVRIDAALPGSMYYWSFNGMSVSTDPHGGYNGQWAPLRPFTLRRGESRQVRLEFKLADCNPVVPHSGGYSVLQGLDLRYRVLGISRTTSVPLPDETIALEAPGDCTTPIEE
jgi:hypothetical protein